MKVRNLIFAVACTILYGIDINKYLKSIWLGRGSPLDRLLALGSVLGSFMRCQTKTHQVHRDICAR